MSSCNLTTFINGTDCIGDTRAILNQNFSNLDTAICSLSSGAINGGTTATIQTTYTPGTQTLTSDVLPSSITDIELKQDSVTTLKVKDGNITTKKLAFDSGSFSFRNKIINGSLNIWQRGSTFLNAEGFTADRFLVIRDGTPVTPPIGLTSFGSSNVTVTRDLNVPLNTPFLYSIKIQRNSGDINNSSIHLKHLFETHDILDCVSKNVTLSYYIQTGTTFASTDLKTTIFLGTGVNQGIINMHNNTWSGYATLPGSIIPAAVGVWQRVEETFTIPVGVKEIGFSIGFTPVAGVAGIDETIYVTGLQFEIGDTATPFEWCNRSTEIARCQRFYEKSYGIDEQPGTVGASLGVLECESNITGLSKIHTTVPYKTLKYSPPGVFIINPVSGNINELYDVTSSTSVSIMGVNTGEYCMSSFDLITPLTGPSALNWHFIADSEMY